MKRHDTALTVQSGVDAPQTINPGLRKSRRRERLPASSYVEGIVKGDRALLGQAITLIESTREDDQQRAGEIIEQCLPMSGNSIRVGITGIPGAGKSTFIETLGMLLIRERGERVAVLAIDPSSQVSGGSILGDKTRMERLASHPMAFIRPSPARGMLGGVARRTRETMLLCEAAGYRNVLVETVGVGQTETAVYDMVDFFLLLLLAGAGDELQGMKRGILELTDLIAVNKADGANKTAAEVARREYQTALQLFPAPSSGWHPRAVTCSAFAPASVAAIWEIVHEHHREMQRKGEFRARRHRQTHRWMQEIIEQGLSRLFREDERVRQRLPEYEKAVAQGQMSSFRAARELLDAYRNGRPGHEE